MPYTLERHPETGTTSGAIGVWLFLASEVMLFGALFTSLVLLRVGNPEWPHRILPVALGGVNTALLLLSSVTFWKARTPVGPERVRLFAGLTTLLGVLFLVIKIFEYNTHLSAGEIPSASTFWGMYYALTGLHAIHLVCGIAVNLVLIIFSSRWYATNPLLLSNRTKYAALYWNFVDAVWLVVFLSLYLS